MGQGTYGNVFKCKVVHTPGASNVSQYVAVKKFKKPGAGCLSEPSSNAQPGQQQDAPVVSKSNRSDKCRRELAMLKLVSEDPSPSSSSPPGGHNPHLVRLLDYFFTSTEKLCLVFEYIDMTLLDVMDENPGGMTERQTKSIIFQVLQGLRQLHDAHNVMHRDVKPENVLVDRRTGVAKLCDLGFAREDTLVVDRENVDGNTGGGQDLDMTQYVSTRWYRAPELLLGHPRYSKSIDVWAVGCMVVEMLSGKPAFPAKSDLGVLSIISDALNWRGSGRDGISIRSNRRASTDGDARAAEREKERRHGSWLKGWLTLQDEVARDFILMCLRPDSDERATVEALLRHPWIATMDWLDESYERGIHEAMRQTASIQATVMACKRLRKALSSKQKAGVASAGGGAAGATVAATANTSKRHRQHSLAVPNKPPAFSKHAYYTPQVVGIGVNAGSIGAVYANGAAHHAAHQKKKSNGFWLDTPAGVAGALASPKPGRNPEALATEVATPSDDAASRTDVENDAAATAAPASNAEKRSLAQRLLDKLKF